MAKPRKTSPPPSDRRARREAQRASRRAERRTAAGGSQRRFSPLLLVTAAAVVLGVVIIGFVALQGSTPTSIITPTIRVPSSLAHDRTIGDANAKVSIDVWSDFQCPACASYWTLVNPQVITNYIQPGQARLTYHDYAFIGPESLSAAVAARCANKQGPTDFWSYHDFLYANRTGENVGAFTTDRLVAMAKADGLNTTTFSSCLNDQSVANAVTAETDQGKSMGINGTPTIYVNGTELASYDYGTVSAAIDKALGISPSASPSPGGSTTPSASLPPTTTPGTSATASP
jgi:protein-disulfide isomerase